MTAAQGSVYALGDHAPELDPSCYLAPGARVIGRVRLHAQVSVWFNAVLRGDLAPIEVGPGSNIQDNVTIHVEGVEERRDGAERGTLIGRNVTVGHNCIVHSCVLEDDCLIGMGAVVLSGAVIGRGAVVAAGAVVLAEARIPPYALAAGNPAQVKKTYSEDFVREVNLRAAEAYRRRIGRYKQGLSAVAWPK